MPGTNAREVGSGRLKASEPSRSMQGGLMTHDRRRHPPPAHAVRTWRLTDDLPLIHRLVVEANTYLVRQRGAPPWSLHCLGPALSLQGLGLPRRVAVVSAPPPDQWLIAGAGVRQ